MKDQFIKVAAATPCIRVADPAYNTEQIIELMRAAAHEKVKLLVLPELSLSGYTCGDLFLQESLLQGCLIGLKQIIQVSENMDMITLVGLPFSYNSRLYNVAAVVFQGELLGLIPKTKIPNYSEFYEARHFCPAPEELLLIDVPELGFDDDLRNMVWFGSKLLFSAANMPSFVLGAEICEDLWTVTPPSNGHVIRGATVIANLSASDETTGKDSYRRDLVRGQSARLICGYIYADAGEGESSTDLVFSGHNLIAENGTLLKESERFTNGLIVSELDLGRLVSERRRITTFPQSPLGQPQSTEEDYQIVSFHFDRVEDTPLTRYYHRTPFVPTAKHELDHRCNEILHIQAMGLKKRLEHTHCSHAVIGISGGLDSTLALLVTARAFDLLSLPRDGILCVTMPCFGTTDRTYRNACTLTEKLGATLREVPIHEAVELHFRHIGHDPENHDITYENSQARQRTLILMDLANEINGMVIGTGDMSELALGWATYNGDHMSMYGVNASVPKTLVRHLVQYFADTSEDKELRDVLNDILDTPVSPELLPPENGKIAQKTENIVGPYELHDFFLYYMMRFGYTPAKIFRLATYTFKEEYDDATIYKWLHTFYRRFFSQQFKRSCLPDGPKVGSVALSPRGDWRMPSDASAALWMEELEDIKPEK
ncbi:MAG: NAD(+) synthase [Lachnospiraceae bacterium]|nr:NAD(+) synthase [Lachnospiraceae bacterium]